MLLAAYRVLTSSSLLATPEIAANIHAVSELS